MKSKKNPVVFVSYSHDSPDHKMWVSELATRLVRNGVEVVLDQWDSGPGDDLAMFMANGISQSDRVLVICTDEYVRKAEAGEGGVGYEGLILNGELVRNTNTNKFIPIIRQASGEKKKPHFLGTRFHVDATSGAISDEYFDILLKALYKVQSNKPALGRNPYLSNTNGSQPISVLPLNNNEYDDLYKLYADASLLVRNEDLLGWRQLIKELSRVLINGLNGWRSEYDSGFNDQQSVEKSVDTAIQITAPLMIVALVGVESGSEKFCDQRGLFDSFYSIPEWGARGGWTKVVRLPETLSFVYQALHGALCLNLGQLDLALNLSEMNIKHYGNSYSPLWKVHPVIGWPHTLGENCSTAWNFISSAGRRWSWLNLFFGNEFGYKASLCSYYMALNVYELAQNIANKSEITKDMNLDIPLNFVTESYEVHEKALNLLMVKSDELKNIWSRVGVTRDQMAMRWAVWQSIGCGWVSQVYRNTILSHRLQDSLPHDKLL